MLSFLVSVKRKIVLYDTLIQNHTEDELVAVLAHEVGHFKKKHIISSLILSVIQTGIMLFIMSFIITNKELSVALGAEQSGIHLNLIAFTILYAPVSKISGLIMNLISRKNEFEADHFASSTFGGTPLIEALKKLSVNNLSNLTPHKAYVFFHYSHPPLLTRLRAIEKSIALK
jgi:STE24 endopeptidase